MQVQILLGLCEFINLQLKKYMHSCMEIHILCIFYENVNNCQEILQYNLNYRNKNIVSAYFTPEKLRKLVKMKC
jgi:adenosine deaminase